jgi:adenylosuccinate lyase
VIASSIERLATNIRHWQRTEINEAEEYFSIGQKGSSAMPHKRNPIGSENLCGLARLVRSSVMPALEDIPLWHERDISHSSVERIIAPDSTSTLAFMLDRSARLVDQLVVYPDAMRRNLAQTKGLFFSEAVLLALVAKGMKRQDAYVLVQRNAMKAIEGEGDFCSNVDSDAEILSCLTIEDLQRCFDLDHCLRFAESIVLRALQ